MPGLETGGVSSARYGGGRPAEAAPIPPLSAIDRAMHIRRSPGPEGREHLLESHEKKRFVALYPRLSPQVAEGIEALLREFSGEPVAESLILRAVLARLSRLVVASPSRAEAIMGEVERFSTKMRGLSGEELLLRASVLDLDSTRVEPHRDPLALWARRGVIHPRGARDAANDDKGLLQRFDASCGPTVIEMLVAQADPVFAFALFESGLTSQSSHDRAARFQRLLLEQYGGVAIGLREMEIRARTRNGLGRLERNGHIRRADGEALLAFLAGGTKLQAGGRRALVEMRTRFGFPTDADIKALRREPLPDRDVGLGYPELAAALAKYVTPLTGITYRQTSPPEGFARGQAWRHLDRVARALRSGINVPFGLTEPSHWMLMTQVTGKKPNRAFLISDPAGGRTDWVKEKDVTSGVFADEQFHLCTPPERGYIDSFYLP